MTTTSDKLEKLRMLIALQECFPYTEEGLLDFAELVINTLIPGHPHLNRVQADILRFLFNGGQYRMVQAQRGQAKTTITAIYSVFILIHLPTSNIMIVSQVGKRALEIAQWVVNIMRGIDILNFMQPDRYDGDKSSVMNGYDINGALKGHLKDPSLSCYSIEGGIQGARASLIIADDIESLQNSRTSAGRELLEDYTKEFESINSNGDIVYLGTPQTVNSIYNNLASRGYDIRIWTGRYPTKAQRKNYGRFLAPMLDEDIARDPTLQTGYGVDGKQGAPTCPEMFDDDALCTKEISQGTSKFQLQYMLNTRLNDEGRYPLKLSDLTVMSFNAEKAPVMPVWSNEPYLLVDGAPRFGNRQTDYLYRAVPSDYAWKGFDRKLAFIDPAGGGANGDETGVAVIGVIGTYIYLIDSFGARGGYDPETLTAIVERIKLTGAKEVVIEKNFGYGAFTSIIKPFFQELYPVSVTDDTAYVTGQKEVRIADTLEPVIQGHRLIINASVIQDDYDSIQKYATDSRTCYSLFSQMSLLTRERNCLKHDDRLDALYGAVAVVITDLDYSQKEHIKHEKAQEQLEWVAIMNDPSRRVEFFTGVPVRSGVTGLGNLGNSIIDGN